MVTGAKGDNSGRVAARRVAIEQDASCGGSFGFKKSLAFSLRPRAGKAVRLTRQNRYDGTLDARREPRPLIRTPVGAASCGAWPLKNRPPGISSLRRRLPRSQLPPIRPSERVRKQPATAALGAVCYRDGWRHHEAKFIFDVHDHDTF
jgi:hypothetical protein